MADCGQLTIEPAFDSGAVTVDSCPVPSPDPAAVDESVSVEASVRNSNEQSATVDVVWTWGGTQVASRTGISVAAGASETVSSSFVPQQEGISPDVARSEAVQADVVNVSMGAPMQGYQPGRRTAGARARSDGGAQGGCSGCERRSRAMTAKYRQITRKARRVAPGSRR